MSKFNWGHGITIFYTVFVCVVIYALVRSFGVDHSLVVDDYYQKDIEYQTRFDKESRALTNKGIEVEYDQNAQNISIRFKDAQEINGTVLFYRPSDKSKDFTLQVNKIETDIPSKGLDSGKWIMKMDCVVDGEAVYLEEILFI